MSTAQNNVAALKQESLEIPVAAATAIKQGDFIVISSKLGVVVSAATDVAIGFSDDSNPVASLGDTLTKILVHLFTPRNAAFLPIKSGDTPGFWDALYQTSDPQIVTTSSAGSAVAIGRCIDPATFGATVTGDGVARYKVLLGV